MKKSLFSLLVIALSITIGLKAQTSNNYLFSSDSLRGFDEASFIKGFTAAGLSGIVLKHELATVKREFIHQKYFHFDRFEWSDHKL